MEAECIKNCLIALALEDHLQILSRVELCITSNVPKKVLQRNKIIKYNEWRLQTDSIKDQYCYDDNHLINNMIYIEQYFLRDQNSAYNKIHQDIEIKSKNKTRYSYNNDNNNKTCKVGVVTNG